MRGYTVLCLLLAYSAISVTASTIAFRGRACNASITYTTRPNFPANVDDPPICNPPQIVNLGDSLTVIPWQQYTNASVKGFSVFSGDMMFDAARLLVIRAPDVAPSVGSNGYLTTGESNSRFLSAGILNSLTPVLAYFDGQNGRLGVAFANSSEGSSWLTAFPGSAAGANTGMFSSLKVLSNGNVGIAYRDNTLDGGGLFYISSTNNAATAWNAGILLHSGSFVGLYASLFVNPVTSFPMIAHFDIENNDIYFVKATDVSGTAWGTSSMIEQDGGSDVVLSMSSASGGRAIIAFLRSNINSGTQKLFLKVANEADPLTWGASFQVSAVDEFVSGFAINMLDGSHLPAIAYSTYRDAFNLAGPNFFETYVIYSSTVAGNGAWSSCPHSSATPVETTACIASIIDNDSAYHRVSKLAWVNLLPGTKSVCATPVACWSVSGSCCRTDAGSVLLMYESTNGLVYGRFFKTEANKVNATFRGFVDDAKGTLEGQFSFQNPFGL